MPRILNPRTLASALRTTIYGAIAGYFTISNAQAIALVDAILVGAILADYSTWLLRSIALLPSDLWHGCYDVAINLAFGIFFFRMAKVDPTDDETLIMAFLVFLAVAALKLAFYAIRFFQNTYEDDE